MIPGFSRDLSDGKGVKEKGVKHCFWWNTWVSWKLFLCVICLMTCTVSRLSPRNSPCNHHSCESGYTKPLDTREAMKQPKMWALRTPLGSLQTLCWRYFGLGWVHFLLGFFFCFFFKFMLCRLICFFQCYGFVLFSYFMKKLLTFL